MRLEKRILGRGFNAAFFLRAATLNPAPSSFKGYRVMCRDIWGHIMQFGFRAPKCFFPPFSYAFWWRGYLEGQGGLVSRLRTPVTHIVSLVIPIANLLTKSL